YTASAPKTTATFKTSRLLAGTSNSGFFILLFLFPSSSGKNTYRHSVSQRKHTGNQFLSVFQLIKIFPHPFMNGSVPSFHHEPGFNDISVLQYVIRHQYGAFLHQAENLRQKMKILSLCRIHEDEIKRARQFF